MACERCAFLIHRRNKISGENPAGDTLKRPGISRDIRDEIVKRIARNGVDEYLIPRNDALGWNKTPAPIRQSFHPHLCSRAGVHGKQVARSCLRSGCPSRGDGKGARIRKRDTLRTQYSTGKSRTSSAARRKRPGRRDAYSSREAGRGVSERVTRRHLDRERNTGGLCRDVSAGRRFHKEVVERPGRYSDC